jgi:uncharacterized damage-inducible protein DinB
LTRAGCGPGPPRRRFLATSRLLLGGLLSVGVSREGFDIPHLVEGNPMNYAETILPEFDQEMANTRKVLERAPEDKLDWRAHPKSNTIGWNANHLAEIPGWVEGALTMPSWDIAPAGGERYQSPRLTTRQEILDLFDRNVAAARKAIAAVKDEEMGQQWSLLQAGKPLFTLPRAKVIRNFVLNHLIHHRAILCVYLRLNDIPVPGMYGPSGDE